MNSFKGGMFHLQQTICKSGADLDVLSNMYMD